MLEAGADLSPFIDFETASRAVLALLRQRLGFNLWMMTRTDGNDWVVLQVEDHGYNVKEGSVFRWADSFCSQMVLGRGPRIAPCAKEVPSYAEAPIGRQVAIGAYIGVPIKKADGSLFGTLCAIDPTPQDESIQRDLPWIELVAKLLGTILADEMKSVELARELEQVQQAALLDPLTGFLNRKGWDQRIVTEEARSRRYGCPACVLIVKLDIQEPFNDVGDNTPDESQIRKAANCILKARRQTDIVAHFGDGEFVILGVECDAAGGEEMSNSIRKALVSSDIAASIGVASRDPSQGLLAAISIAKLAVSKSKV